MQGLRFQRWIRLFLVGVLCALLLANKSYGVSLKVVPFNSVFEEGRNLPIVMVRGTRDAFRHTTIEQGPHYNTAIEGVAQMREASFLDRTFPRGVTFKQTPSGIKIYNGSHHTHFLKFRDSDRIFLVGPRSAETFEGFTKSQALEASLQKVRDHVHVEYGY